MGIKKNNALIESWYAQFDGQLSRFFGKAVSAHTDLQDLSQEVYLRMLRVKNPELIHSPRPYLYRVAIHVLDERRTSHREQHVHYEFGRKDRFRLFFGVNNIGDNNGPFLPTGTNSGSSRNFSSTYDPVGRFFYTGLNIKWY